MGDAVRDTSGPVPLPSGLAKRFYGSIILLSTLNECFPPARHAHPTPSEPEREVDRDLLRCFIDKLAHICDSKHGGDTVTAITILQPGCIQYRLSSNSRAEKQFGLVKMYLADVLGSLGHVSEEALADEASVEELCSKILLRILAFTKQRINVYITGFLRNVDFCIGSCDEDERTAARSAAQHFRELQTVAQAAQEQWPTVECSYSPEPLDQCFIANIPSVIKNSHALLYAIKKRYTGFEKFLRAMARDDMGPGEVTPWTELRHAISRLHSYSLAVKVIVEARKRWPELFDKTTFEIIHVPSASRGKNPIQMKGSRCSGRSILGSLSAEESVIHAYQECAMHYQNLDENIDTRIFQQIKAQNYSTLVHAEVNLANSIWLENQDPDAEEPVRCFKEHPYGRYIGCSKPTCLLCSLYFDEQHPMHFERRPTHGNLYTKWRAPDILGHEHIELLETRRLALEGMVQKVKRILSDTILTRTGIKRKHDSRQTPTDPFRSLQSISVRATTHQTYAASEAAEPDFDQRNSEDVSFQGSDVDDDDETRGLENMMEHLRVVPHIKEQGDHVGVEQSRDDNGEDDDSDGGALI